MKSLYEKQIKKLDNVNLALHSTKQKLSYRIFWFIVIGFTITTTIILEDLL